MKKRILILMMLLTAMVTGAWGQFTANSYFLTGTIAEWWLNSNYELTMVEEGLYKITDVELTTSDLLKVIKSNINGTTIANWYPDGMDNNQQVDEDGTYTIYFRPAGDGTEAEGYTYIPYEGDGSGLDSHGCTHGGYMLKFEKQVTVHDTEYETACDYFVWHGNTYTASGEYTYDDGTDIYKLNLTIHYSTSEIWEREVYMGQHFEEGPFDFVVTSETELTQTGVTTNAEGCDNVITLVLTIVQGPGIDVEEAQKGYDFGEVPPGELAKIDIAVTNSANFGVQAKVTVPDGFDWEKMLLFTNNYGWEKVYLYAWDADGTPLTGAWPGTELTKTITNDYAQQQHIATIPIGTTGIIFTAGADGPQTSDISDFNVEGYYMYEGSLYSWGEEPQFAIPANSEGTLTVYLTSDDPGVRSGNIVLEPRMGDTTPIVIPISATVSTGIDSLTPDNAAKGKEIWYDLSGRRLMGEPTQHGVYINKGKKVNK